ncbi:MAG: EamA family transporter [Chloroflexi bacterium]|nr:EamA family transporter [Chloroflexota bacterium]
MPLLALVLVLIAAFLHAFWNLLAKDAHDSSAFMWWGVALGATWYGVWVLAQTWIGMPIQVWLVFIPSIIAEVAYVRLITRGYATGDLSQVYPIARGAPPLLIALWSAIFLNERLPLLVRALLHRPAQFALLAAICVSIYSTLDKLNMQFVSPIVYNVWVYAGIAIGYAPVVWVRSQRAATVREIKTSWRKILIGSVATISSYALALTGMAMTAASYVGAVRATSVVIGALFGWLWLKESFGPLRVFASCVMLAGLILIALA